MNKSKAVMYTNLNLICLIILNIVTIGTSDSCYWNSECVYNKFSSKTPYNNVRGDIRDSIVKLKGCKPISIWTLIRHGQRSPGVDFARNMLDTVAVKDYVVESYRRGNSSLCAQDVENLRDWKPTSDLFGNTHGLTGEGYQEILGIGRRLQEAFSELLTDLEDESYILRSTYGRWVEDGVEGFVKGLSNKSLLIENADPRYDIMAPYEACPKYFSDVKHNTEIYSEATKYENSQEYVAAKNRIQKLTGIPYILTNTNITSLYDLCRYTWVEHKGSPWCALLKKEDLFVLEYYGDLRHYYRNGYGTPMNKIFGQIPMADLYNTFNNNRVVSNRKLTAYFTHATMMDMAYSALGWFKDEAPLTSAYRDPNRKWRSSTMGTFAGNLMAVLNRCRSLDGKEDYKIVFYFNEEPATWMCDNSVCSWEEFENKFKDYLNTTIDFCFT